MTNVSPNVKQLWPLHPLQRRIYTVRELARAQGFPDDYEFCSTAKMDEQPGKVVKDVSLTRLRFETEPGTKQTLKLQQIKQIGNAVAVPFALALGKELGEARIVDWKAEREREDSPEF